MRPKLHQARTLLSEAERDREYALEQLEEAAAGLLLGTVDDLRVQRAEAALDAAERGTRRWRAAKRALEERLGIIRDSEGNVF